MMGRLLVLLATVSLQQMLPPTQTHHAFESNFAERVDGYMALRRTIQAQAAPCSSDRPASEVSKTLAVALAGARLGAKPGDIFGSDAGAALRPRILVALEATGYSVADLLVEINIEAPGTRPVLSVNGRFDWRFGALMPPALIAAMPTLPDALQYRFVGRDLVLVDVDAGLIVDLLPDVLVAK